MTRARWEHAPPDATPLAGELAEVARRYGYE